MAALSTPGDSEFFADELAGFEGGAFALERVLHLVDRDRDREANFGVGEGSGSAGAAVPEGRRPRAGGADDLLAGQVRKGATHHEADTLGHGHEDDPVREARVDALHLGDALF